MKITAITKFRQGDMNSAVKRAGISHMELARRAGISYPAYSAILNLRRKPSRETCQKIQNALAEAGEFLDVFAIWPEKFVPLKKSLTIEQTEEIEVTQLNDCHNGVAATLPEFCEEEILRATQLLETILDDRERIAVKLRSGFDGNAATFKEIGVVLGVCLENARRITNRGLAKLRTAITRSEMLDDLGVNPESREAILK